MPMVRYRDVQRIIQTFSEVSINQSNFLVWYYVADSPTATELPRPFVREPDVLSPVVWLVSGETVAFYINTSDSSPLAGGLEIISERGESVPVVSQVSTIEFPGGSHTYGSFTVPNIREQFCRLRIGNYLTQHLWMSTAARAKEYTATVRFRNKDRILGYRWGYLPEDFYQQFRVRLAMKGADPSTNKEVYTGSTTGKTRHSYSEPRRIITFATPEYDDNGHAAMAIMLEHDEIEINGIPCAFNAPYKANMSKDDTLSEGEFAVSDERYSSLHRS